MLLMDAKILFGVLRWEKIDSVLLLGNPAAFYFWEIQRHFLFGESSGISMATCES